MPMLVLSLAVLAAVAQPVVPVVDFSQTKPLRPKLHSAGLGGQLTRAESARIGDASNVFSVEVKGVDGLKCTSVKVLDSANDFTEAIDVQKAAHGNAADSRTPFSPSVTDPVFYREGNVFRFEHWEPNSAAWLLTFE